jgi:hypothetical protein
MIIARNIFKKFSKIQIIPSQKEDQAEGCAFSVTVAVLTLMADTSDNVVSSKILLIRNLFICPY